MEILNNREIATLIWTGLFVGWVLVKAKPWAALAGVVRSFGQPVILWSVAAMAAWVAASAWLLWRVDLWEIANLKTTIVWFATFAVGWMFNVKRWEGDPNQNVRAVLKEVISVTVIITFLTETYTFSLPGELIFVPIVTVAVLMAGFTKDDKKYATAAGLFNGILAVIGWGMLLHAATRLIADFAGFATVETGREFAVPALLSLLFIPFMYAFSVLMGYQHVHAILGIAIKDPTVLRFAQRRAPLWFGLDVSLVRRWKTGVFRLDDRTPEAIRELAATLKAARRREKRPPIVLPENGWCPHIAGAWLAQHDLAVAAYDPIYGEWTGSSPSKQLRDGIHRDYMTYRVTGTAHAATRLSLSFDRDMIRKEQVPAESLEVFSHSLIALLVFAFREKAIAVADRLKAEGNETVEDGIRVRITDDDRTMKLEIVHPAHIEMY